MTLRMLQAATREVAAAARWYETNREGLGAVFVGELDRAIESIAANPEAWQIWPGTNPALGIRRLVLPRFPYAVAFIVRGEATTVVALAHGKRRPLYWLARIRDAE
jgi:toxin ParE1/3/4